jgi:hypothetical protein
MIILCVDSPHIADDLYMLIKMLESAPLADNLFFMFYFAALLLLPAQGSYRSDRPIALDFKGIIFTLSVAKSN